MNFSEFHKKLAKTDEFPRYIKFPLLTLSSWFFQGILYMDTTERAFKILLDVLLFFPLYFVIMGHIPALLSVFMAIIVAHTLNWVFNGQIFVLLKLLKLTKTGPGYFNQYLDDLKKRIEREDSILAAAAFGSLSRKELKETSDLDVRIIRKKGLLNGLRACLFVLLERNRAFFNKFPLDIYVLDHVSTINKHIEKTELEKAIVLYDPAGVFRKFNFNHNKINTLEVVMVYAYDPSKLQEGGGIRYVHNLVEYLLKNNTKVTLLGVQLAKKQTYKHPNLTFIPLLHESETWWEYFIKLMIKVPLLKFSDSAIIHAHRTYFMLPFILFHRKNPKVCTLHMKPLEFVKVEYPQYLRFVNIPHKLVESFCLKRTDVLIAVNEEIKLAYEKRYPEVKGKIRVISGSGVDLDRFRPIDKKKMRKKYEFKPDEKIILFAGRIEKIKNLDFLIRSFTLVLTKVPNARLVIVGRGSEQENLVNLAKKLGIEDKIIFMGEVNPENMPEVLNCSDVFALSSLSESSPTVVREALACGIPVVSTNVGDVSGIITDPLLGTVVNEYDEKLFADALIKTIELTKAKPEEVKEKCREVALERFSFEKVAKEYINVYKSIVKRGM